MVKPIVIVSCILLGICSVSFTAIEDQTTVTVTVQYLSVDIQGTPSFGTVGAGSTFNLANTSCTVINNGNWESKWSFKCSNSDPAGWTPTSGAAPANNTQFRLCAVFKSTAAVTSDFEPANDYLNTTYRLSGTADDGPFYEYAGYGGQNVAAGSSRNLWLSFCAPTTTPSVPSAAQQTITVYVQTQAQ